MQTASFKTFTDTLTFMLAGNARVTFQSDKTGARYTYRVSQATDKATGRKQTGKFFVSLLTGSDNESDYTYMGMIQSHPADAASFRLTKASKYSADSTPVKAFAYTFNALVHCAMPQGVTISHEGRCGRCGRTLTVPSSIENGIGPDCMEKMAA